MLLLLPAVDFDDEAPPEAADIVAAALTNLTMVEEPELLAGLLGC